jgi:hypothetical protein
MPADTVSGSTIPEDTEAEVLLRNGAWTWARVIGQRKDRHGRWCIGLRWYASPSIGGREGWFLLDLKKIRRPDLLRLPHFPTPSCRPVAPAPARQRPQGRQARDHAVLTCDSARDRTARALPKNGTCK